MKALLRFTVALLATQAVVIHAQLLPGDVTVVAYNTGSLDDFAWVAFKTIPAGTVLNFTDSSVSNGFFRMSEHLGTITTSGPLTWSDTNDLPAGTVVKFDVFWDRGLALGAEMDLSASGDQIFIYQGAIVTNTSLVYPWQGDPLHATLLFGINFANNGWDNLHGGSTSLSAIPPGLSTNDYTAVHVNNKGYGYYTGPRRGSITKLRQAIATPANWTTSNSAFSPGVWPSQFEIVPPNAGMLLRID